MFTFGAVVSAIAIAPIAVIIAAVIVIVFTVNVIIRELMLAAWDISVQAISDIEGFVKSLVSENISVVKEANKP